MRTLLALLIPWLVLPGCAFLEGRIPTTSVPLFDMEEPLALHEEPDDEQERRALPAGCFTGAYVADARQSLSEMEAAPEGLAVTGVVENSPADAAGLREGDLLLEVGGKPLHWASEWRDIELGAEPGTTLDVLYDRAGAERSATLHLVARVHPAERHEVERYRDEARVGIVVRTATEVEARAAGLGPGGGAVVVGLSRGSPWRAAGLRYEDLIVEVGGQAVAHPDVLLATIRDAQDGGTVPVVYVREGRRLTVDAPVSRRAQEITKVRIPLLYGYEKDRDRRKTWFFFWIYKRTRTPAAWETRLFWFFVLRGGDADHLVEVDS